ncbi:MAG TPA: hypothetical protein ENF87_01530, partial [Thermoproteales archaeon]|nr:hypothetical protein [Thermoproteales archaeon]
MEEEEMKLEDYFYLAWTSLSERRGRSIGAVLGVIIAVLALSLALGIGQSFQRVFEEEIGKTLAANSIFLISNTGFTDADIAYLRNIPGVRTVFGVGVGSGVVMGSQGE